MKYIEQFSILVLFYILGETLAKIVPLPGNVIGFILLICCLKASLLKSEMVKDVTDFLQQNLALLFIPSGVGLLNVYHLFDDKLVKILTIVFVTTVITFISTSLTVSLLTRSKK